MNKKELIKEFSVLHFDFLSEIEVLSDDEFIFCSPEKWSAGQQLLHIILSLKSMPKILSSKEYIMDKFGLIDRPTWSYEEITAPYKDKKFVAPAQFSPEVVPADQRDELETRFRSILLSILEYIDGFTEEELDSLSIPHPYLGKLTIRELFYFFNFHVSLHHSQMNEGFSTQQKS